jgi:N-acetylneuraminate lyase
MQPVAFFGIMPAVITPFDDAGHFAPVAFERLLARLYAAGVHGVYVTGQTGEGMLQPPEQRKRVAEVAVRSTPAGKSVVIHVGAHRPSEAVDLVRHAARIGAHAISSLPPAGAYSLAEVRAYYETLAAATDLPLLVYYFPEICPAIQGAEQVLQLLDIPNVIGLKFTDFDLYKLSLIKKRNCVVFNGKDEVLTAGLLMGADGGIGSFYNLIPEVLVEAYELTRQSRWEEARLVQKRINELVEIGLRFPLVPAIKTVLRWQGLDCGEALPPRRPLKREEAEQLRAALESSSFAHLAATRTP